MRRNKAPVPCARCNVTPVCFMHRITAQWVIRCPYCRNESASARSKAWARQYWLVAQVAAQLER